MKQPTFCGRELLPLSVIEAARAGDPLAVERVLRYYEGYMDKLCTRSLYDLDGTPHVFRQVFDKSFCPPTDHRQKALIFVSFLYPKCVDRRGFSALVFSISFVTPLHSIIHILFLVFFE